MEQALQNLMSRTSGNKAESMMTRSSNPNRVVSGLVQTLEIVRRWR